jgi:cell division septation protein DedD
MSDQNFREIQLSGKQLVFLFMSAVVLAVVIFLLGVSVGRGVRGAFIAGTPSAPDLTAAGDTMVPATLPPPVVPNPAELDYHETLQGQPAVAQKPTVEPPSPPAAPPPGAEEPAPRPAEPSATSKPAAPAAPAAGDWLVQVDAFSSKANADRRVTQLKTKGFDAFISDTKGSIGRYRVRIGPFVQKADADAMVSRLKKEGFTSKAIR